MKLIPLVKLLINPPSKPYEIEGRWSGLERLSEPIEKVLGERANDYLDSLSENAARPKYITFPLIQESNNPMGPIVFSMATVTVHEYGNEVFVPKLKKHLITPPNRRQILRREWKNFLRSIGAKFNFLGRKLGYYDSCDCDD